MFDSDRIDFGLQFDPSIVKWSPHESIKVVVCFEFEKVLDTGFVVVCFKFANLLDFERTNLLKLKGNNKLLLNIKNDT
jgi:hypothetical protein